MDEVVVKSCGSECHNQEKKDCGQHVVRSQLGTDDERCRTGPAVGRWRRRGCHLMLWSSGEPAVCLDARLRTWHVVRVRDRVPHQGLLDVCARLMSWIPRILVRSFSRRSFCSLDSHPSLNPPIDWTHSANVLIEFPVLLSSPSSHSHAAYTSRTTYS